MAKAPRMTLQTQLALRALLADPAAESYGLQLCGETGLPAGTIYPILARLEQAGWGRSSWEDPAAHVAQGRPRRRDYPRPRARARPTRGRPCRTARAPA